MSAKKSWDIQPSPRQRRPATSAPAAPTPAAPQPQPRKKVRQAPPPQPSRPQAQVIRERPHVSQGRDRESLKERRRRQRRRRILITLILLVSIVAGAFGGLWWNVVRIQAVAVSGPDASGVQLIAAQALQGTNHFVIPNNSIFFYPAQSIRTAVLEEYPDVAAVSISRTSFSTILVSTIARQAALTWCGTTYPGQTLPTVSSTSEDAFPINSYAANATTSDASTTSATSTVAPSSPEPTCYNADGQGIIFQSVPANQVDANDSLVIYAPLAGNASPSSPLGATIAEASMIPNALQLVKIIKSLDVPITTLVLRGDEADLYAQSGTRITYVLGREEQTAQVAEAAFPSLNINDGSLQYVDLRFAGKAYYKKYGEGSASSTPDE
jgi:hypothetical protein